MKKKVMQYFGILLFALIAVIAWKPQQVQAATSKVLRVGYLSGTKAERTVGKAVFSLSSDSKKLYVTQNGKKKKIASTSGDKTIAGVAVKGSTVYYGVVDWVTTKSSKKGAIYKCSLTGKNNKKVKSTGTYIQTFTGIYKNKIYYIDNCFGSLYSVNVKTGKVKKEVKGQFDHYGKIVGKQNGKYIYLNSSRLYAFNAATGKKKSMGTLAEAAGDTIAVSGKYVYFLSGKSNSITLYRCKADGSGKKALAKNLEIDTSTTGENWTLTGTSLTYSDSSGETQTIKF